MPTPPPLTASMQAVFEQMIRVVRDTGSHGQLEDVRDRLNAVVKDDRPLTILCPHADDGAITAACLLHEYAVRRRLPVVEVLVFAGERNVAAPWLNDQKKVSVRESEFRLECNVLGAEAVIWDLNAYRNPGYEPAPGDLEKVADWFCTRTPGALIVPPSSDAHLAHRMTRAYAAGGLVAAGLRDTLVLSGWTPWGPLSRPNAYFTYDGEAERTKEWAIHCHASQVLLTDYTEFCTHLGRAYAALTREWAEGHTITGRAHKRASESFVGVELFEIETYNPSLFDMNRDPIQRALGILNGQLPVNPADSSCLSSSSSQTGKRPASESPVPAS
ncbi:PIG-L deacetylase family protein [Isosphaera pallida]|nr:PIG-L family deacetylase [Isosphaera pallida]